MQGALNASAVIAAKRTKPFNDPLQVIAADRLITKVLTAIGVTGSRQTASIQHHLQQVSPALGRSQRGLQRLRQQPQQTIQIVGDALLTDRDRGMRRWSLLQQGATSSALSGF